MDLDAQEPRYKTRKDRNGIPIPIGQPVEEPNSGVVSGSEIRDHPTFAKENKRIGMGRSMGVTRITALQHRLETVYDEHLKKSISACEPIMTGEHDEEFAICSSEHIIYASEVTDEGIGEYFETKYFSRVRKHLNHLLAPFVDQDSDFTQCYNIDRHTNLWYHINAGDRWKQFVSLRFQNKSTDPDKLTYQNTKSMVKLRHYADMLTYIGKKHQQYYQYGERCPVLFPEWYALDINMKEKVQQLLNLILGTTDYDGIIMLVLYGFIYPKESAEFLDSILEMYYDMCSILPDLAYIEYHYDTRLDVKAKVENPDLPLKKVDWDTHSFRSMGKIGYLPHGNNREHAPNVIYKDAYTTRFGYSLEEGGWCHHENTVMGHMESAFLWHIHYKLWKVLSKLSPSYILKTYTDHLGTVSGTETQLYHFTDLLHPDGALERLGK